MQYFIGFMKVFFFFNQKHLIDPDPSFKMDRLILIFGIDLEEKKKYIEKRKNNFMEKKLYRREKNNFRAQLN